MIIALALCVLSIQAFTGIVHEFIIEQDGVADAEIFVWMDRFQSPFNTKLALSMSFLGSAYFLVPAYLVIIYIFIRRNKKSDAILIGVLAVVSSVCGWILKEYFQRSRPSSPLVLHVSGFSFPSGHSLAGFTFYGLMIYLIYKSQLQVAGKVLLILVSAVLGIMIALSRIYLHVHYASDVLASFFITIVWLSLTFICHRLLKTNL